MVRIVSDTSTMYSSAQAQEAGVHALIGFVNLSAGEEAVMVGQGKEIVALLLIKTYRLSAQKVYCGYYVHCSIFLVSLFRRMP